jgi:16S rRNA C1402 N4-methylase RsmH
MVCVHEKTHNTLIDAKIGEGWHSPGVLEDSPDATQEDTRDNDVSALVGCGSEGVERESSGDETNKNERKQEEGRWDVCAKGIIIIFVHSESSHTS